MSRQSLGIYLFLTFSKVQPEDTGPVALACGGTAYHGGTCVLEEPSSVARWPGRWGQGEVEGRGRGKDPDIPFKGVPGPK